MKLGVSSYTFPWSVGVPGYPPERPMGPLDLLRRAAELGVEVVQVADNLPLDRLAPEDLDAFERLAAELKIEIEVGTCGIQPDHLRNYLSLAQRFRSPFLRIVIDTPDHHPDPDEIVEALRQVIADFERAGVRLAIENHDRFKARTLLEIIQRAGSEMLGICLDTSNSFGAQEGPEVVLHTLGPLVLNLHLKDFVIRRYPHKMGLTIEGRPVGQGQLDVPWLLSELRRLGRNPNIILEQWVAPEPDLAATIAKEHAWVEQSLRYVCALI